MIVLYSLLYRFVPMKIAVTNRYKKNLNLIPYFLNPTVI